MKNGKAFQKGLNMDGSDRVHPGGRSCLCRDDSSGSCYRISCSCKIEVNQPYYNWNEHLWIKPIC